MVDEQNILDAIDGGIIVVDNELNILFWNGWLRIATGIDEKDAISKKLDEVVEIEQSKLKALTRNIKTSLSMDIMTFMTPAAHGYLVKIPIKNPFLTSFENMQQEVKIVPLDKKQGKVGIFITDHTAIMDSHRVVKLEKQKVRDILDAQNELLFVTDGFKISMANQKFLSFFGCDSTLDYNSKARCLSSRFEKIDGCFWAEQETVHCEWFEDILAVSNQKRFVAIKSSEDEIVYFIIQVTKPAYSQSEYIVTLLEASQEFLYQKELEKLVEVETAKRIDQERLLVSQSRLALLGEMIAAISHQMRQPLSAIKMLASDVEYINATSGTTNVQVNSDVNMIYAQVKYMNDTISSFRNFLMPSSDDKHFDIVTAIKDVVKLLSAVLKELDMELNIEINGAVGCPKGKFLHTQLDECGQILVLGNEIEFKQVLVNLISNTKDALVELKRRSSVVVGSVVLEIEKNKDGAVSIKYRDHAGGIPQQMLPEMFKPYKTTKGDKGTGIGMYMSKQIIDKMGGSISVENIAGGAMFTIVLKGVSS